MRYKFEITLHAGEKEPIYAGITTPVVNGVQSTFLASVANFTLSQNGAQVFSPVNILSTFPNTQQANPTGYYDLDTGAGNPSTKALALGFYDGLIIVTGTGSDSVARTDEFYYLIEIIP